MCNLGGAQVIEQSSICLGVFPFFTNCFYMLWAFIK